MTGHNQDERIFDDLFQAAVCQSVEDELALLIAQSSDEHVFSREHKQRIRGILSRHKKQIRLRQIFYTAKRAAVVALVILVTAFCSLMTIEAVRSEVIQAVTEWFEKFTNVRFTGTGSELDGLIIDFRITGMMLPGYIPEGYEQKTLEVDSIGVSAVYENSDGHVIVYDQLIHDEGNSISLDNEQHDLKEITFDGYDAVLALSNQPGLRSAILVWHDGIFIYSLTGSLDEATILDIAESLQEPKNIFE